MNESLQPARLGRGFHYETHQAHSVQIIRNFKTAKELIWPESL
jgi:hypothetical protein